MGWEEMVGDALRCVSVEDESNGGSVRSRSDGSLGPRPDRARWMVGGEEWLNESDSLERETRIRMAIRQVVKLTSKPRMSCIASMQCYIPLMPLWWTCMSDARCCVIIAECDIRLRSATSCYFGEVCIAILAPRWCGEFPLELSLMCITCFIARCVALLIMMV